MLPKQRRTGLFSATQTNRLEDLMRAGLRNPVRVVISEQVDSHSPTRGPPGGLRTPAALQNFYAIVDPEVKFSTLIRFLLAHSNDKILCFLATCACVDYFARLVRKFLPKNRAKSVYALHRKLRKKRTAIFNAFRNQSAGVLICTDVMARGVDIPQVSWVLQCDPPTSANAFVHRCGRTARCGAEGRALLFLAPNEVAYVNFLEINQKVQLTELLPKELDEMCAPALDGHLTPDAVTSRFRTLCKHDRYFYSLQ
ncbi:ATP-dependent RNA helicase DDX55 [Fasciolopsis buskii]|uniref:ATP-dependent RNA helicase n=1 Tax=Fasciolopsis buskii TaxID=27845 RepID=A0A8E0RUK7_9TREM|nr:ATP-dependent RNA helicase DDX55 [Fasciolopsis buski]